MMKRRHFLSGAASFLSFTPLTPLIPSAGIPQVGLPLPYATAVPNGSTLQNGSTPTSVPAYLGLAGPESGSQLEIFQQLANGVRGAISDTNNLQGSLGRTFDVHLFDDSGNPSNAPIAANSLISDAGVLAAIGHLGSATTDAALSFYAQAQVPIIVPVSTADSITRHGYRNVFRLATSDSIEGELFARHLMKNRKYGNVAIVTPTDGYGPSVAHGFSNEISAQGAKVTNVSVPVIAQDDDLDVLLKPMMATQPELLYFAGTTAELGRAFQKCIVLGFTGTLTACQGFFDVGTITTYGHSVDGLLVSSSMPPLGQSAAQTLQIQTYNEQYGSLTPVAAFAYAAAQIALAAIGRTSAVSRPPIITAIAEGGTFTTIVGDFRFDAFGDPSDPNLYFYKIVNNAWKSAGSYRPSQFT